MQRQPWPLAASTTSRRRKRARAIGSELVVERVQPCGLHARDRRNPLAVVFAVDARLLVAERAALARERKDAGLDDGHAHDGRQSALGELDLWRGRRARDE